jgi:biopolymer transport protein ExbD
VEKQNTYILTVLKITVMAEIENKQTGKRKNGLRMIKKSTRVDLTPMVDLGFLLITFFVFTTSMAKPKVMSIVSPKDSKDSLPICESCALTLIPVQGNKVLYYEGIQTPATILKETDFTAEGLRALLMQKKEKVKQTKGTADEMVLIIKPAQKSTYKNFVDILDEVAITDVKHYFIDELTDADKQQFFKNQ